MNRIFLDRSRIDISSMTAHITGQDHVHLASVLRARVGDPVTVLDGLGSAYSGRLTALHRHESVATLMGSISPPPEPPIFISVGQALGKADKIEQVIKHGTEAGASAFFPIRADRCVVDVSEARIAERLARWRAIAKCAAEQSFRARIPDVRPLVEFPEALASCDAEALCLLLHPEASAVLLSRALLGSTIRPKHVLVLVGPEGGWSASEIEVAAYMGRQPVSLGPHVLRTETAALVAISQLLYHFSTSQETPSCES